MSALVSLVLFLLFACAGVFLWECDTTRSLLSRFRLFCRRDQVFMLVFVLAFTLVGSDKSPVTGRLFKLLFWHPASIWQLDVPARALDSSVSANVSVTNNAAKIDAVVNTHSVTTYSFDWHAPDRLPYHARQNVLGWNPWVFPTNIAGVLYEDHCVAFNATASTNPAVILIEYASRRDDGTWERYFQPVITNSYPDTRVVTLQSGAHTCYWFRCEVPVSFTNRVRDWNGEVLFGSPPGSGKGFDMLGTLVVDDGNQVWIGATTNIVLGTVTNSFQNGMNVTKEAP